jgi:hypothetical protein
VPDEWLRMRAMKTEHMLSVTRIRLEVTVLTFSSSESVRNSNACEAMVCTSELSPDLKFRGRSAQGREGRSTVCCPIIVPPCGQAKRSGKRSHKGEDDVEVIPGLVAGVLRVSGRSGKRQAARWRGARSASAGG